MVWTGIVMGCTRPIRETVDLKPLDFIAARPEEDVSGSARSPGRNPQSLLSQAWQEPLTSAL